MTTDYSTMTNAELLAAYEAPGEVTPELYDAIAERLGRNWRTLHPLSLMAELERERDAARAEAQRLREQRDACLDLLHRLSAWYRPMTTMSGSAFPVFMEDARALLDTIAAEDASAQGGDNAE